MFEAPPFNAEISESGRKGKAPCVDILQWMETFGAFIITCIVTG
jgi:hypothetical protein